MLEFTLSASHQAVQIVARLQSPQLAGCVAIDRGRQQMQLSRLYRLKVRNRESDREDAQVTGGEPCSRTLTCH